MKAKPAAPSSLVLKDVPEKGRGVFAKRALKKGEEVLQFLGNLVEVDGLGDLTHCLQVGPRSFLTASGDIDDYVNHSCEPNTGIRDDEGRIVLFALRAIAAGDEITFDYSTTQAGGFWEMACGCGTKNCRGRIGDFANLPPDTQAAYERLGAVLPFLVADKTQRRTKTS